ncbi:hypothetical protein [Pedobacter sp. MR2016-24]|uniref:hypothetical protein n=1 Tax=Pedobacter sp. MR2016-24 TaxID=2994466 RepID=UPI002245D770|nr:hypothetical protein [Pedobacter sp. MR2016-24]MCX2486616.1 hypothetical protein [Pedobacter sp. MR2016-24]
MTNLSKIFYAVCLFITAISIAVAIYSYNKKEPVRQDDKARNIIVAEATIIAKKFDKNGAEHTIVDETNNILPANLIASNQGYDVAFVDSLISVTDIQKKEIVSLTQINQTISGKNLKAVAVLDSFKNKTYSYNDKNLYVSFTPDQDSNKVGLFNYRYNQNLNVIQYNRKKWLLGAEKSYIDISSNDTNSTINGVKKLTVLRKDKPFGMKLTAKSVYLPQSNKIGMGAQLRLRYKRTTISGSNYYFPTNQKWIPVIGLEYDLLNF